MLNSSDTSDNERKYVYTRLPIIHFNPSLPNGSYVGIPQRKYLLYHVHEVSKTVELTDPGMMLKKRVVAKVRRLSDAAKSYLTKVEFESRKKVTCKLLPCCTQT